MKGSKRRGYAVLLCRQGRKDAVALFTERRENAVASVEHWNGLLKDYPATWYVAVEATAWVSATSKVVE
jgi:hypothetical protein